MTIIIITVRCVIPVCFSSRSDQTLKRPYETFYLPWPLILVVASEGCTRHRRWLALTTSLPHFTPLPIGRPLFLTMQVYRGVLLSMCCVHLGFLLFLLRVYLGSVMYVVCLSWCVIVALISVQLGSGITVRMYRAVEDLGLGIVPVT